MSIDAAIWDAAEAAWLASLPACTDPSGHQEGFMGFCRSCGIDVFFEDTAEAEALLPA